MPVDFGPSLNYFDSVMCHMGDGIPVWVWNTNGTVYIHRRQGSARISVVYLTALFNNVQAHRDQITFMWHIIPQHQQVCQEQRDVIPWTCFLYYWPLTVTAAWKMASKVTLLRQMFYVVIVASLKDYWTNSQHDGDLRRLNVHMPSL